MSRSQALKRVGSSPTTGPDGQRLAPWFSSFPWARATGDPLWKVTATAAPIHTAHHIPNTKAGHLPSLEGFSVENETYEATKTLTTRSFVEGSGDFSPSPTGCACFYVRPKDNPTNRNRRAERPRVRAGPMRSGSGSDRDRLVRTVRRLAGRV